MIDDVLHEIMNEREISLQEMSEMTDIAFDTMKNLYYGKVKDPKVSTLLKISRALDVSINYLMGYSLYTEDEAELLKNYRKCGTHGKAMLQIVGKFESRAAEKERRMLDKHLVPCLTPVGKMTDGIMYNSCTMTEITTDYKKACLAVELTNNYFSPTYCKGDRILFENRFPDHREYALFTDGKKCYLRRFKEEKNGYILECLNGNGKDIVLKRMDQMECVGTCIGVVRA